jgi:hypothetical protein
MTRSTIGNAWFYLATLGIFALCVFFFRVVGYGPGKATRYLRRNVRWIALNALLIAAAAHLLMLAPSPPAGTYCVESRQVWGPLTMVVSCDSYQFAQLARDPGVLAEPGVFRQSRPLMVMAASWLTLAELPYGRYLRPEWFSYVILNFVVLLVALMVFLHLNMPAGTAATVGTAALSTFLVFNDVVKGFFWSAHTQMWNVLMPLISIALARTLLQHPARSWRFMTATGALLGIGALAYASLVICVPAAIAAIALGFWIRGQSPPVSTVMGKIGLFVGAFALPSLVWVGIITIKNGAYQSAELQACRQFIWLYDYWVAGGPIALEDVQSCGRRLRTEWFLGEFFMNLQAVGWPGLVLLGVALAVGVTSSTRLRATLWERSHTLTAGVITLTMCLGFFLLMGFYRNRLEFNIVVPVIVMMSVIISGFLERMPSEQAIATVLLVVVAAGGCVTSALVRLGPYV